jgi:hypothetical protein
MTNSDDKNDLKTQWPSFGKEEQVPFFQESTWQTQIWGNEKR